MKGGLVNEKRRTSRSFLYVISSSSCSPEQLDFLQGVCAAASYLKTPELSAGNRRAAVFFGATWETGSGCANPDQIFILLLCGERRMQHLACCLPESGSIGIVSQRSEGLMRRDMFGSQRCCKNCSKTRRELGRQKVCLPSDGGGCFYTGEVVSVLFAALFSFDIFNLVLSSHDLC